MVAPYADACGASSLITYCHRHSSKHASHHAAAGAANFQAWFHLNDSARQAVYTGAKLQWDSDAAQYSYDSAADGGFWPLDGRGGSFATGARADADGHVRYFTTATELRFAYAGADQYFAAAGADDAWVFVNGRLAVDLGGTGFKSGNVSLDAAAAQRFGLQPGAVASLALFTADRVQGSGSSLQLQTNIDTLASW